MSTLYSRGPAETFARVISRTRRSASLARPAERYAATAAVYAAPSGVRDASSRDAATSDFQVEIAAVSDAAASDAASERVPPPAERSLVVPERTRFILASALVRPETTSVYARRVGRPPARTYSSNASRTPSGIPALAPCLTSVAIASGGARTPASSISRANAHACGSIPAAHSASTRRWTVVGSEPSVSRKPPGAARAASNARRIEDASWRSCAKEEGEGEKGGEGRRDPPDVDADADAFADAAAVAFAVAAADARVRLVLADRDAVEGARASRATRTEESAAVATGLFMASLLRRAVAAAARPSFSSREPRARSRARRRGADSGGLASRRAGVSGEAARPSRARATRALPASREEARDRGAASASSPDAEPGAEARDAPGAPAPRRGALRSSPAGDVSRGDDPREEARAPSPFASDARERRAGPAPSPRARRSPPPVATAETANDPRTSARRAPLRGAPTSAVAGRHGRPDAHAEDPDARRVADPLAATRPTLATSAPAPSIVAFGAVLSTRAACVPQRRDDCPTSRDNERKPLPRR